MKVLRIHNYYRVRGGEAVSSEAETRLLKHHGHQVDLLAAYNDSLDQLSSLQVLSKTVWATDAYQEVKQQLAKEAYDIVHVHNTLPLFSPSVYYACKEAGVPVIQHLHNYRLLCPNGLFFRNEKVCEDCLGQAVPLPGVIHGCYRGSRPATAGVAAMLTVHRAMGTWKNKIDYYIALTNFARKKFVEGGISEEKIIVKPHFVYPDPGAGDGSGQYALYVGRLSVEKGLDTLLAAWKRLGDRIPLKIVGDGPLSEDVKQFVSDLPQAEWLGRKSLEEVYQLMGNASVVVVASKWYETFGRIIIESFAKGTPVLTSDLGAIAELVEPYRTGLHFQAGNPDDMARQIEWLLDHPQEWQEMRSSARQEFENRYTAEKNYQAILDIYSRAQGYSRPDLAKAASEHPIRF
jgi:glycosyltransferase involved in cell wall biosynthesis